MQLTLGYDRLEYNLYQKKEALNVPINTRDQCKEEYRRKRPEEYGGRS